MNSEEFALYQNILEGIAHCMAQICRTDAREEWIDEAKRLMILWVNEHGSFDSDDKKIGFVPMLMFWQDKSIELGSDFPLRKQAAS